MRLDAADSPERLANRQCVKGFVATNAPSEGRPVRRARRTASGMPTMARCQAPPVSQRRLRIVAELLCGPTLVTAGAGCTGFAEAEAVLVAPPGLVGHCGCRPRAARSDSAPSVCLAPWTTGLADSKDVTLAWGVGW